VKTLTFMLRLGTEQQSRAQLLNEIQSWTDIRSASPLVPGNNDPELSRMHFVQLSDHADADEVLEKLRGLPEVESADHPTTRGL
jgi:hypothetical protein